MKVDRIDFAARVFKRDNYKCVKCCKPAVDAHHIIDRSLFPDGGYVLDNMVSVCADCHWLAELTLLTCEELRELANIVAIVLPPGFDPSNTYDKWGNTIVDGVLCPGPLYNQGNVRKVLRQAGKIPLWG